MTTSIKARGLYERKVADPGAVVKLAQEAIATQSKDLQLAAWLSESLVKTRGFAGLYDGLISVPRPGREVLGYASIRKWKKTIWSCGPCPSTGSARGWMCRSKVWP